MTFCDILQKEENVIEVTEARSSQLQKQSKIAKIFLKDRNVFGMVFKPFIGFEIPNGCPKSMLSF